jgi:DNA-binding NtrC family response regulator
VSPTGGGSSPLHRARILVVEDDFLLRLEVETVLGQAGAVVRACGTVNQALAAIAAQTFDAAILDVRLGSETVAPVAHKLDELRTPFVFYTAQIIGAAATSQWPQARVLSKPAAPATIVNAVSEALTAILRQRPAR